MRLKISHMTHYSYEPERRRMVQSLRLEPAPSASQRILSWSIESSGGQMGARFLDGAGDLITTLSVPGPVEKVSITVTGEVETRDTNGVLRNHKEKTPPLTYLVGTRFIRSDAAIKALAADAVDGIDKKNSLDRAHALSAAVAAAVKYTPGSTNSDTTAAEAVEAGEGVCQDHAHVLISAAQVLDMPARYVAGYMYSTLEDTGESTDEEGEVFSEASHAWAEIWVEGLGWVGFDPSNECCPDERYVRLCSGRDAFDAAPLRGMAVGFGDEHLDVLVDVDAIQQ
ncbi:MAG: transglutaminase family protein [Mangrovicoccus sp.]